MTVLPAGVTDVAISSEHTCAVVDGTLSCWGSNKYGQLGTGKAGGDIKTPTRVSAIAGLVTSVAAGWGTTCVILAPHGALQCWGRNHLGQVGSGSTEQMVLQPVTVIPAGVTAVAIGGQHTCAVVDGGLQCWGFLLFRDRDFKTLSAPIPIISAGQGVTAVAAALHTCVIVKESLQCWGRNFFNQVGVPEGARRAPREPTTIISSGVMAVAVGEENTCAVVNGELMCWGWNTRGLLGPVSKGSSVPERLPVPGAPPAPIRSVAIGMGRVCVLTGAALDSDASLLQCTNRAPDPEEVDDTEPRPPREVWGALGTEGVGLSEPPPVLPRIAPYGLWQGTIGGQAVMVLLLPTAQLCDARYYYASRLWGIPLTEKERRRGSVWRESQSADHGATWTFSTLSPDGHTLTGEWVSHDGQRNLPIRLNLLAPTLATEGEDGRPRYDCHLHDKVFEAPRIAQAWQERTLAANDTLFEGEDGPYRYRQVSVLEKQIHSLALPDIGRTPRLQQVLAKWESESVTEFYDCAFRMTGRHGETSPDYYRQLAPQFWNATMLVLRESFSAYCGGAYPNGGVSGYLGWDLAADRPVDVWQWIKGCDAYGHIASKRLLDLLAARYSRRNETGEDSCAGALDHNSYYLIYPKSTGMVFSPSLPHVIQACEEDIEIPWAQLRPFLTPAGQEALTIFDSP